MFRARFTMGSRPQRRGWPWWLTLLAYPMGLLDGYLLSIWLRRRQQQEPAG
ncbi:MULTISPECIES: hypothetical protein [Moorella (nom. illeg.)]|uniref:hypothetical protein n=1 Tax=Neomoorella TaxID=44260 RepID=UPI000B25372E|nr:MULTISPECIES: hypothetical protein [Moorella]